MSQPKQKDANRGGEGASLKKLSSQSFRQCSELYHLARAWPSCSTLCAEAQPPPAWSASRASKRCQMMGFHADFRCCPHGLMRGINSPKLPLAQFICGV